MKKIGLVILLCVLFVALALLIDPEIVSKITEVLPTITTSTTTTITTETTTTIIGLPTTKKHVTVVQGIVVNISHIG